MNVEVIEFYLDKIKRKPNDFCGTLHVHLADTGMDIRGIMVMVKNDHWKFYLPQKIALDENDKKLRYPVIAFTDTAKTKQLLKVITEKGKEFVSAYMERINQS